MAKNAYEELAGGDEFLTEFYEYLLSKEEAGFMLLLPRSKLPRYYESMEEYFDTSSTQAGYPAGSAAYFRRSLVQGSGRRGVEKRVAIAGNRA